MLKINIIDQLINHGWKMLQTFRAWYHPFEDSRQRQATFSQHHCADAFGAMGTRDKKAILKSKILGLFGFVCLDLLI